MGWYALVSLIADSRVKFLIGLVIVAVLLAGILTYFEFRLNRRKKRHLASEKNPPPLQKLENFIKSNKTPREKLDYVNQLAKEYFKEIHSTPLKSSYSSLIASFEKHKKKEELNFCKSMFETYYSPDKLTDEKSKELGNLLMKIMEKQELLQESSRVPTFWEKVDTEFVHLIDLSIESTRKNLEKAKNEISEVSKNSQILKNSSEISSNQEKKILVSGSTTPSVSVEKSPFDWRGLSNKIFERTIGWFKNFKDSLNRDSYKMKREMKVKSKDKRKIENEQLRREEILERQKRIERVRQLKELRKVKRRTDKLNRAESSRITPIIFRDGISFFNRKNKSSSSDPLIGSREWMRQLSENLGTSN